MHPEDSISTADQSGGAKTQDGGTPPGAWHCYKPENSNGFWYLNNGEIVVYGKDTSEANARRIVTAVNAHEELVAALRKYGWHTSHCPAATTEKKCTCGLDAVLANHEVRR